MKPANTKFSNVVESEFFKVFLIFMTWRGLFFILHLITLSFSQASVDPERWYAFPANPFLDSFFRWDSGWYKDIIEEGYSYQPGTQSNVAFFPLYPILVWLLSRATGLNVFIAGFLLSNLCLLIALFFIYKISLFYLNSKIASRVLILLLVSPVSFFYSSLYTESLYLLTISASFYFFIKDKYLLSGAWGLLASLTRVTGCLLLFAYTFELLLKYFHDHKTFNKNALYLLLIPCGLLLYMGFLDFKFDDPLAFMKVQDHWERANRVFPFLTLLRDFKSTNFLFPKDHVNSIRFLNSVFSLACLAISLIALVGRKFNSSLYVFSLLSILLPLSTGTTVAMLRYLLPIFPIFIYLGHLSRNHRIYTLLVFSFTYLLSALFLSFSNWGWII